ncbi:two-component system regulatory protein YycI [Sediminibacillus massiliensis]|uniref:two-component system regulatory protein YycI n=1 Tax=Sediminibacillus massiliensis TaxID=1926277 RepID=UPI00098855A6|nr:two-component system regulatory protein YycI [Sediminibacillus massiliensis]
MQWNQIKTLFILCFLILNIFLLQEFVEKREQVDLELLSDSSTEEKITDNIKGLEDLSDETVNESYISAKRKQFTLEDVETLEDKTEQEAAIINGNVLYSKLEEPISLSEDTTNDLVQETLESTVLSGSNYHLWNRNEDTNTMIFFQHNQDLPIYYSQTAYVLFIMNEQNQVTHYIQTMLEDIEEGEPKQLIKPSDAVANIYSKGSLKVNDEVTADKLGYYQALSSTENEVQVYAPTWKITINGNQDYFVNAVEGHSLSNGDISFLQKTADGLLTASPDTEETENEEALVDEVSTLLEEILEITRVSGE